MVWGGKICISYIRMVSFYAFRVIFIDTVFFKKGTRIKMAGVRGPGSAPDIPDISPPLVGTPGKLVSSVYYVKQQVCVHLQPFLRCTNSSSSRACP